MALFLRAEWIVRAEAEAARAALDANRLDDAEAAIGRLARQRPTSGEAQLLRARLALARGRAAEAADALDRAAVLGAPDGRVGRLRGLLFARTGRTAEAEPHLVQALTSAHGPDPEVAEALARHYLSTYQLRLAATVLDRWARDAPADARPYLWRAEVDRRMSADPALIVDHYRAALARAPDSFEARRGLAETLLAVNRFEESGREFAGLRDRQPNDPALALGAARAARGSGDRAEAARLLDLALTRSPDDPAALRERAGLRIETNEPTAALADLDRAVALDPHDAEAQYTRGRALMALGRRDEAQAAQATAARLRADQDRLLKAQKRLLAEPENDALRLEVARWLIDHGRGAEGVRWAQLILARRPDDPAANRLLADHYDASGQPGLAKFYRLKAGDGR